VKLGIALEGVRRAAELGALAARVEALGFDSLWTADHVSFSQPICDPFQVLSIFAVATRRITLGTCVYVLPLRHPTHVAKMAASLDWLSGGRLVLGVGVGGEFPAEFAACEVPRGERDARANGSIPILRALWTGGTPPGDGRFFHVPPVSIAPAPARAGGPPIWVGGRSPSALRRAAHLADGYLGYFLDAAGYRTRLAEIRELRAAAPDPERRGAPLAAALMSFARVERDRSSALERAAARLGQMYGAATAPAAARFGIVGSPEDCRSRIAELEEAGVEHLVFSPIGSLDETTEQLERLASLRRAS